MGHPKRYKNHEAIEFPAGSGFIVQLQVTVFDEYSKMTKAS